MTEGTQSLTIRIGADFASNWCHVRHFHAALVATDGVKISTDSDAPVDFYLARRYSASCEDTNADRTVLFLRHDPHTMVLDCDVSRFAIPEMVGWLRHTEYRDARFDHSFHVAMTQRMQQSRVTSAGPSNQRPFAEIFAEYNIIAAPFLDVYDFLRPRVPAAQFLRVPISVPERIFFSDPAASRFIDVFFMGAVGVYYPLRALVLQTLRSLCATWPNPRNNLKFWHASAATNQGQSLWLMPADAYDAQQLWYADCLRHSKMMIFDGTVFNYPVQKFFEAMACGCLVLAPAPREAEIFGFVDGATMVAVNPENFMEKIYYYKEHTDERQAIVDRAYQLVQANYTCTAQARIFVQKLQAIRAGTAVETLNTFFTV